MTARNELPASADRRGLIFLLGVLVAIGAMSIDLYLPALPALGAVFGVSVATMQLTVSCFLIGLACGQAVCGPLADRYGRKLPLVAGLVVFVAGSVLAGLAPNAACFIVARALQGFGAAAAEVIPMAIVADLWRDRRAAQVLSILQQILALSPVAAPLIGAFMLQHLGWRSVFAVLALFGAIMALAVSLKFEETLPPDQRRPARIGRTLKDYVGLLRQPHFAALAASGGFIFASCFAFIGGSSFIIIDQFGFSPMQFSLIFGVCSLGMIAFGQLNIFLLRVHQPDRILPWALALQALSCAGLLVLIVTGRLHAALALPLFFANFCAYGLIFGNLAALVIASATADRSGLVSGAYGILGNISGAVAGVVVGIFQNGTATPPVSVIGICGCVAAVIWFTNGRLVQGGSAHRAVAADAENG